MTYDDDHHVGAGWWRAEGKISWQYDYHYMMICWSSYDVRKKINGGKDDMLPKNMICMAKHHQQAQKLVQVDALKIICNTL